MCTQNGRSIPEYVTELYQKSKHCEFGIKLSEHLRDRFVFGLDKAKIRSQILHSEDAKKKELTFNRAVELAKAIVAVNAAETLLKKPNSVLQTQTKRHQRDKKPFKDKFTSSNTRKPTSTSSQKSCHRCGTEHAHLQCPAWGKTCGTCGKANHFKGVCQSKDRVKAVDQEDFTSLHCLKVDSCKFVRPWKTTIELDEKCRVKFEIDSGSPVSIVPLKEVIEVREKIRPTCLQLKDFSQNDIPLAGELTVANHEALMKLYVAKDPHSAPILGIEWIQPDSKRFWS